MRIAVAEISRLARRRYVARGPSQRLPGADRRGHSCRLGLRRRSSAPSRYLGGTRLPFDQNLSFRLCGCSPISIPVRARSAWLASFAPRIEFIWEEAKSSGFVLVSQDLGLRRARGRRRPTAKGHLAPVRQSADTICGSSSPRACSADRFFRDGSGGSLPRNLLIGRRKGMAALTPSGIPSALP